MNQYSPQNASEYIKIYKKPHEIPNPPLDSFSGYSPACMYMRTINSLCRIRILVHRGAVPMTI